jgi:hypothetical protein
MLSYGEWIGGEPSESVPSGQEVKVSMEGGPNLQGFLIYVTTQFDNHPILVAWRYQDGGQSGHVVTASRENFEI